MKAKVLRAFIDRGTGTGYNAGEVYESSASSRLDELTAAPDAGLHLAPLQDALRSAGIASEALVLPAGEGTKSWPWTSMESPATRPTETGRPGPCSSTRPTERSCASSGST